MLLPAHLRSATGFGFAVPLASLSSQWRSLPQQLVPIEPTQTAAQAPPGMLRIPAGDFDFVVGGVEIEGQTWEANAVQYPWEDSPRRRHRRRMRMQPFHIDRTSVTNAQFRAFLDASGWRPRDPHNFLRHWRNGAPPPGWDNKPVTWVSIEDARAYAQWAGRALPNDRRPRHS